MLSNSPCNIKYLNYNMFGFQVRRELIVKKRVINLFTLTDMVSKLDFVANLNSKPLLPNKPQNNTDSNGFKE